MVNIVFFVMIHIFQENIMKDFQPFKNETQSITVGPDTGITFENSTDSINVYGDIQINKDTTEKEIDELITVLTKVKTNLPIKK